MVRASKRVRYNESKALRSYWSVHIEAWLRSGVCREAYCREHRLTRATMKRWIKVLETPIPKRHRVEKKLAKMKLARMPAARTIAFKAFWMMHSEAQHDSGLTPIQYANAHRLPVRRMRRMSREYALRLSDVTDNMLCRSFVNNAGDLKKSGKSSLSSTEHDQLRWRTPELAKAELLRFC